MNRKFISAKCFFSKPYNPHFLYKNIWKEKTTCLLHSPREIDKTMLALSIADEIASKGRDVLYVNATDSLGGLSSNRENLYIFNPEFESIDDKRDYADLVLEAIEEAVRNTSIRTFVIDSISRIAALSFGRNATPTYIMKRIVALQVKCKLSVLALADDTTKNAVKSLIALSESNMCISLNDEQKAQYAEAQETNVFKVPTRGQVPVVTDDCIRQMCKGVKSDLPPMPVCRPQM
ncbi:MAG: DNA repair protein RadA [Muribaculaceae bacterium]|nr:DNA repair protein RadA [Muribaculaceae bacterium]